MTLLDQYKKPTITVSFELFPPKTEEGLTSLDEQLAELMTCDPSYITCTYGAGGSTRDKTLEVLSRVRAAYGTLPTATHLTCVGSTVEMLREYLHRAVSEGVRYVVALRGDPPKGETGFTPVAGGFCYSSELVTMIKEEFPGIGIAVAGYPEKHPEASTLDFDIENLKRKVDAGADVVITQLFYDNEDFYRWRDKCLRAGIQAPLVPGVLPVTNLAQVQRLASLCGARIPEGFAQRMAAYENGSEGQFAAGVYFATRQVDDLISNGAPGVHFYVLNRARATAHICRALALSHQAALRPAAV